MSPLRRVLLVAAIALPFSLPAQDLSVLRAFHGFGDPSALAVNAAATRAYVGESASVAVLDLTTLADPLPPAAVLARVHVDASVVGLTIDETNQRLLIAGGSFGLCSLDLASATLPMTVHDDPGDEVCFEAALSASHVVAVFGAKDASLVRVYDRGTLALIGSAALGTGTAFAVALDGSYAYVAMGTGGLARVDLSTPSSPAVAAGPVFPNGVFGEPARARDIAIANGRIFVAADTLGVVTTRTSLPWGPSTSWSATALAGPPPGGGAAVPMYGFRVDAVGSAVHVGATRVAGREQDGGPFTSFGPMGYSLAVGGVVTPGPLAEFDAHVVFQAGATGLTLLQQQPMQGRWRELVARTNRVYGTHAFAGTFVRDAASIGTVLASHHGGVYLPAEALTSLHDPDLAICGQDGAENEYLGLLDLSDPDALAPVAGTASLGSFGLWFDAQWRDGAPDVEWFVGATGDEWRLWQLDVTSPSGAQQWVLPSPNDPLGDNGRNYYFSALDGDLLLLTRGGTRWGLVGWSRSALQAEAVTLPAGSTLTTPPLWQLETHFTGELPQQGQTWRCRVFELPSGQRVAAVAAGINTDASSANHTHAQIVLYDVTAGTAAVPTLLATFHSPNAEGNAMAVVPHRIGATTWLFVGDFGHGVHVYDVSTPSAPVLVGSWASAANAFDGLVDHVIDLELDTDDASGDLYAYVAAWRRGLVRLEVGTSPSLSFTVVAERDTPGLPYGLQRREAFGAERLLLADHQAGLRLYGEWASWQPFGSGCGGAGGALTLEVTSPPVLGGTLGLVVGNLTGGSATMVLGYSTLVPPLDLQPLGLGFGAGCELFVAQDVLEPLVQSGGTATWSLPIPNLPSLRGTHLYQQAVEIGTVSAASPAGDAKID